MIEHLANPIRALLEWNRVLKDGGLILVVVPEGARTFDHARDPTPLAHLLRDFHDGTREDDKGHLEEILRTHDIAMDPTAGGWEEFARRSRLNEEFRAVHHHVFTLETLEATLRATGFTVDIVARVAPFHLMAFGRRSSERGPLLGTDETARGTGP